MRSRAGVFTFSSAWILGCWAASDGTKPKALIIPPSEYFEGNDGPWSSFNIRVGIPEQVLRVLVSTASPESLVVQSELGCSPQILTKVPDNCAVSRGVLFNTNQSSTWHSFGTFGLNQNGVGLEANLGYSQRTEFALETLGIGLNGPILQNQTVGAFATAAPFYLGVFGLNNQPVNFSTVGNYSSPSFLTTLKDHGTIPSLSWSYTAGAKYRLKQVYGQLIFSGYDTSRFKENTASFTMAGDVTRDLVVALQSISYSGGTSTTLLSDPIDIFIDSTDPNLWLPGNVCDAFEKAFGLTLDQASGLYLVNDTQHTALQNSDAQVTFRLSDVRSGGDAVTITLPYAAFDLTAQYPLVNTTSHYFPLKRAANSTQYTLGRTFLQEAYLTADYERGLFNVSACTWNQGAEENLVTITSKDSGDDSNSGSSGSNGSSLGGGAIAGIVVGIVAALAIAAAIAFFMYRRRQKVRYTATYPEPDEDVIHGPVFNAINTNTTGSSTSPFRHEPKLPSQEHSHGSSPAVIAEEHGNELDGEETHVRPTTELDGTEISQIPGQRRSHVPVYELAGSEIGGDTPDNVSTVGTLPSRQSRDDADEGVSTMGSTGWHDGGISDIVSPTTPVRHTFPHNTHHGPHSASS